MRRFIIIFLLTIVGSSLLAQPYLTSPSSNPMLFPKGSLSESREKLRVLEDSVVYFYDTLQLPFIDDFSVDHFSKRITDINASQLSDTMVYSIYVNGNVDRSAGYSEDSTFTYLVDPADDSILLKAANPISIIFHDITSFPTSSSNRDVFAPYSIYDTLNGGQDTVFIEPDFLPDSQTYYFVPPDSNVFYTDRSAYRNTTFAIDPPSIGVVTFDGLDANGIPYDLDNEFKVQADQLTSVPLDLSNLPDSDVYISFYYQAQGRGIDKPEPGDSLLLDFYNANTQRWKNVWRKPGEAVDSFKQEIIRVPDDFHLNGFRFRFRNYATSVGGFDQWHLDYIYLNNNRSESDTIYKDLAYVYDGPTLLKDYTAMPWFHFKLNPANFMIEDGDSVSTFVVNNSDGNLPVYNKLTIRDTVLNTIIYQDPPSLNTFVIFSPFMRFDFRYPIDFSYDPNDIDSAGIFEAVYDVDFRPSGNQEPDFIRSNDTVIGKTVLKNYYAYDDGTAEAGFGIVPELNPSGLFSFMAVEFNIPIQDSVGGVKMYFFPQTFDIRKQTFEITIWNSLDPPNVIYRKPYLFNPIYTTNDGFVTYYFDSLVEVNQTFYIGLKSIGENSLNIGYDLNTNSRQKIFWSNNGTDWSNSLPGIFDGSLMFRPIFKKSNFDVGLKKQRRREESIFLYPNPVSSTLNVEGLQNRQIEQYFILDINGRVVKNLRFQSEIDVSTLKNGLYFLRLQDVKGKSVTKKFIVSH